MFTGAAVDPVPRQDVFTEQKSRLRKARPSDNKPCVISPPKVRRKVCANLTPDQQQQRMAKLQMDIDFKARQLRVHLLVQNLIKPMDSSTVYDTVSAHTSLPDYCSDLDLLIAAKWKHVNDHLLYLNLFPVNLTVCLI